MGPVERHLDVVRMLADGKLHSGEAIAERLGITRAAVWKAARKAGDALGLTVETVRGRGYRLAAALELLDREQILGGLSPAGRACVHGLEIHDSIDSTNTYLIRRAQNGAASGVLCLAERQTAGRGRRGRSWVSPYGANIYLSLLWRYPFGPSELAGISLAAGTAVATALWAAGVQEVALKWPNDVLWGRRKLAGLLLEVAGESGGPSHVVVGVGINTRLDPTQAAHIDQPWVDLTTILGSQGFSRNRIAASVADELIRVLDRYGREGLAPFVSEWERFDHYLGERVQVSVGDQRIVGTHAGITERGALRVRSGGSVITFHAGEVSLRPAEE
jgi:BirA family biotin operon repressor/biotin-[acetyl-CoA-carboxylase] ligase